MNTTSKIIAGMALLASLALAGCSTTTEISTTTGTNGVPVVITNMVRHFDAVKTAKVMHQVIPAAVVYANKSVPQYRQYIVDAQVAACALVGSTNVSPASIHAIFEQAGINNIRAPETEGVAATVYGIYSAFYDDLVTARLPQNEIVANMTVLLQAICDSLSEGLAKSPPPGIPPPPPISIRPPGSVIMTNGM